MAYNADPFIIPRAMAHLFNKPLSRKLTADRDTLRCWLQSIHEARRLQLVPIK
jgi:hypothetical protein